MAQTARMTRRMMGLLQSRLPDARFNEVEDPRDPRGVRWGLDTLLTALVVASAAGCRSLAEAEAWLGSLPAEQSMAQTEDVLGGGRRCIRRLYATEELAGFGGWEHLRLVLRVESETRSAQGRQQAHENRYFLSSLPACRLTAAQWLRLVRNHWGVENDCHGTLDLAFEEDDHPWIEAHPRGALAIALLRRVAYNLLTLFRSVTQRSDERRQTPWRMLMHFLHVALLTAKEVDVAALRTRRPAAV